MECMYCKCGNEMLVIKKEFAWYWCGRCGRFLNGDQHLDPGDEWLEPLSSHAVLADVRAILNGIVNPIQYMQRIAKESGSSIDGRAAVELANDVSYYRALAKEALEKLASISA